jgi:hypothetical protein
MFQQQSKSTTGQQQPQSSNGFSKTMVAPSSLSATIPSRHGNRSLGSTSASIPTISSLPKPVTKEAEPQFLKAAFKIGSTHGRINFENEERVFHRSDVPEKAVSAQTRERRKGLIRQSKDAARSCNHVQCMRVELVVLHVSFLLPLFVVSLSAKLMHTSRISYKPISSPNNIKDGMHLSLAV